MTEVRFLLFVGLGILLVLGPVVLIFFTPDDKEGGRGITPRRLARSAFWIALAFYAVLGAVAATYAFTGPPGPPLIRLLSGVARMSDGEQAVLVLSATMIFGAWWRLRGEARRTDPEPGDRGMS